MDYLAALGQEEPDPERKAPKLISPSDPASAWTASRYFRGHLSPVDATSYAARVMHVLDREIMVKADEAHRAKRKTPYNERTDLEKLQSQWNKLSGLHLRDEPSAAIVRCATAAEIAANYAIRHEWAQRTDFDATVIDHLLFWANGLKGKVERVFVPVYFAHPKKSKTAKALITSADKINKVRNEVVHQGRFSNATEASEVIAEAKRFIDTIVGLSQPGFDIQDLKRSSKA